MKIILTTSLMTLLLTPVRPDVSVYALLDPNFGNDLLVVIERSGEDAEAIWDAEDEELQEARTAAGEVLESSVYGFDFAESGANDPTRKGFEKVAEGHNLLIFKFRSPSKKVKSIPRFAGTYELLHGGAEHWIDVPFREVAEASAWKDESLDGSGFDLQQGVREIKLIQVKLSGEIFDVQDCIVIAQGADEGLHSAGSTGHLGAIEYSYDLGGEEPHELTVRITLEDGTVVEIDEIPRKSKYTKVKNGKLAKAKLLLEVRETLVLEAHAEGKGSYDLLRGYRWVDKRGKRLALSTQSQASGGKSNVSTSCRVPAKLPRGARMQLGVLVGAAWETISFEYEVRVRD